MRHAHVAAAAVLLLASPAMAQTAQDVAWPASDAVAAEPPANTADLGTLDGLELRRVMKDAEAAYLESVARVEEATTRIEKARIDRMIIRQEAPPAPASSTAVEPAAPAAPPEPAPVVPVVAEPAPPPPPSVAVVMILGTADNLTARLDLGGVEYPVRQGDRLPDGKRVTRITESQVFVGGESLPFLNTLR